MARLTSRLPGAVPDRSASTAHGLVRRQRPAYTRRTGRLTVNRRAPDACAASPYQLTGIV
jgi:hypothetical protein